MSDFLSENSIPRYLLILGGIAIASSALAAVHPWIAGCAAFLLMTIVVGIVALKGDWRTTALIVCVAVALSSGVCWYAAGSISVGVVSLVNLLGTMTLSVVSTIVCKTSRQRQEKISELEAQQFELVRKVYDYERSSSVSGEIPVFGMNSMADSSRMTTEKSSAPFDQLVESTSTPVIDPDVFDFAMLLLSMQQIGNRLSSELELDSLVAAILGTAKDVLRCEHAELHLWNARDGRFTNAVSPEGIPTLDSVKFVLAQSAPAAGFVRVGLEAAPHLDSPRRSGRQSRGCRFLKRTASRSHRTALGR